MRVLFISDVYFPRVNGVSTSIRTFRQDLSAAGVRTLLVAPHYEGADGAADGAHVLRIPASGVPGDPEDRRMAWGALKRQLASLPRGEFDLVHIHTPFIAHYAGVRFARANNIPCVATYHTFFEEYLHHYVPLLPRVLGRQLARGVTRSQCAAVNALVAPSQPMRAMLTDYGVRTPIAVIPTGLPASSFKPGDGARFRAQQQLPSNRPLLLYVGRVAHEKNIDFLLTSFVEVKRARPDALLVIAGEGPARKHLGEQVQRLGLGRDVAFVGYLDREQALADCYAAASVFVFASRTETQGLVLLEALAQGCPVVSTSHLGTASILQPNCGARVAPEDPAAFAAAATGILDDPQRAAQLGMQGRSYAHTWSSESMAGRMREFYSGLR